mgnify:CR=1 FL=1
MIDRAMRIVAMPVGIAMGALIGPSAALAQNVPSAERGKVLYESRCGACHSVDAHRVGPAHQGVVGRKAGSAPGFDYSKAVAASRLVWTRTNLLNWLAGPEAVIPGQAMNYSLGDAGEREDVVAYLATLKAAAARP